MGTGIDGFVNVALHQSQFLQPLGHTAADGEVDIHVLHAGLGHLQHIVMTRFDDAVDFQLALREPSVDGHGARMVGAVVVQFAASVAEYQASVLQWCVRRCTVHNFAVLREDGAETVALSQRAGYAVHLSGHEALGDTGLDKQLCSGVHDVADVAGSVDVGNFLSALRGAHFHDGLYQLQRCGFLLLRRVDAREVHNLDLRVVAVGGQEVERFVCCCATATD